VWSKEKKKKKKLQGVKVQRAPKARKEVHKKSGRSKKEKSHMCLSKKNDEGFQAFGRRGRDSEVEVKGGGTGA